MASSGDVDTYVRARRQLDLAVTNVFNPPDGSMSEYYARGPYELRNLAPQLDSEAAKSTASAKAIEAALLMTALAFRARAFSHEWEIRNGTDQRIEFSDPYKMGWPGYSQASELAKKYGELVEDLVPSSRGLFTMINIDNLRETFWRSIDSGAQETVTFTGLNGAGKSTIIAGLDRFFRGCGLKIDIVKFPRTETEIGSLVDDALHGRKRFDPRTIQFLFVADALNEEVTSSNLTVYDRHPQVDALVYADDDILQAVLMSARELFVRRPMWTLIVERHPARCQERVVSREQDPRIFETGVEKMTEQAIRYGELTTLPGVICVGNDLPTDPGHDLGWAKKVSVRRVISSLSSRGILQRELVREGITPDLNRANGFLSGKVLDWGLNQGIFGEGLTDEPVLYSTC